MTRAIAVGLCIASLWATPACKGNNAPKNDPWSSPQKAGSGQADAGAGFDPSNLKEMLEKVVETLERPGPYEAPETSPGQNDGEPHMVLLDLSGEVAELETYSWSGSAGMPLRDLRLRFGEFAKDGKITGVLLRIADLGISMPDAYELRESMSALRKGGKKIHCHAERLSNVEYVVATACDTIALAPLGELVISGPITMSMHVKGLLDKLGVTADFVHVGAYKGAAEPLTRRDPSPQARETLAAIVDAAHAWMVEAISQERKLAPAAVVAAIDKAQFGGEEALAAKLVDSVASYESWRDGHGAWKRVPWEEENSMRSTMRAMAFLGVMPTSRPTNSHIALVYAVGNISDGSGEGVLGAREGIYSHTLVSALRVFTQDDNVKAVVLRVDSGGGSALASELIWQQLAELAAKKPLVVSMSDYAASGGYYISAPAARIFALPTTLTGSIGVVGGKISPGKALANVGIDAYPIGKGKHAALYSSLEPWNAEEKSIIEGSMRRVYATFVSRVAKGRNKTAEAVEPIAQGRVWTGKAAVKNGLVDEIGGLDAALAFAQSKGGVDADQPLEIYPPAPTLRDVVVSIGGAHALAGTMGKATVLLQLQRRLASSLEGAVGDLVTAGLLGGAERVGLSQLALKSLLAQVASFATTHVQTVVILPQIH